MPVPLSRRRAGARNGARLSQQTIDAEKARQQAEKDAAYEQVKEQRRAAREAESARVKLTADDLAGATFVRTDTGWHRVVRVNAKSVTVATAYSWTDRHPIGRVLEAR